MSSGGENESEILLGNKQLLGIFFVIAFLLFVAFTGGYFVGRGSSDKKALVAATASDGVPKENGLETHPVGPATSGAEDAASEPKPDGRSAAKRNKEPETRDDQDQAPLGSPKQKNKTRAVVKQQAETVAVSNTATNFEPQSGQMFLQVTVLARDDAYGVAEVLAKKGFRAHAVPKPGSDKQYRVLVGPIHDTSEFSNTREALRQKTGFVGFLQRY